MRCSNEEVLEVKRSDHVAVTNPAEMKEPLLEVKEKDQLYLNKPN